MSALDDCLGSSEDVLQRSKWGWIPTVPVTMRREGSSEHGDLSET